MANIDTADNFEVLKCLSVILMTKLQLHSFLHVFLKIKFNISIFSKATTTDIKLQLPKSSVSQKNFKKILLRKGFANSY